MSVYVQKNYGQPTSYLQRYTMRVDGFGSVHANYEDGEMLTKPIRLNSNQDNKGSVQLHLNAATSAAGSIRVEIQGAHGKAIAGYSLDDFDEFIGDQVDHIASWADNSSLSSVIEQTVRLRFVLKDADVYSIQAD